MDAFPTTLTWVGDDFCTDDGEVLATVSADVLHIREQRLLVESSLGTTMGFRVRATATDGQVFTMRKEGFTVHRLVADCTGRHYILERTSPWRKERRVFNEQGEVIAYLKALVGGQLVMKVREDDTPIEDIVFLSFGCLLVDIPVKNLRY